MWSEHKHYKSISIPNKVSRGAVAGEGKRKNEKGFYVFAAAAGRGGEKAVTTKLESRLNRL